MKAGVVATCGATSCFLLASSSSATAFSPALAPMSSSSSSNSSNSPLWTAVSPLSTFVQKNRHCRTEAATTTTTSRTRRASSAAVCMSMVSVDTLQQVLRSPPLAVNKCASSASLLLGGLRGGGGVVSSDRRLKTWLVGHISDAWKVLLSESGNACHLTEAAFRLSDLAFILGLTVLPETIFRFVNNRIVNKTFRKNAPMDFENTPYMARITKALRQVGQVSLLVYFGELFLVFLNGLGVKVEPKLFATLVYNLYTIHVVCKLKDRLIDRIFFSKLASATKLNSYSSRKLLYARTCDAAIYLIGALIFLDANNIDVGVAVQSLLTVGGISSVVIGFALKEPVTEIIQGTSVLLSNKFIPGDTIRLADGTCGKVQRFEWTDVTMQGDDNSFVRIPHSQLAKTRIVNLSRMPCSQVSQEIRLPNRGSTKIQQVLHEIKSEIRATCPELDESQPFLVHWTSFEKPDNVVITIEAHFRIPLLSSEYWDNRQNVLMAINQAIEQYNSD